MIPDQVLFLHALERKKVKLPDLPGRSKSTPYLQIQCIYCERRIKENRHKQECRCIERPFRLARELTIELKSKCAVCKKTLENGEKTCENLEKCESLSVTKKVLGVVPFSILNAHGIIRIRNSSDGTNMHCRFCARNISHCQCVDRQSRTAMELKVTDMSMCALCMLSPLVNGDKTCDPRVVCYDKEQLIRAENIAYANSVDDQITLIKMKKVEFETEKNNSGDTKLKGKKRKLIYTEGKRPSHAIKPKKRKSLKPKKRKEKLVLKIKLQGLNSGLRIDSDTESDPDDIMQFVKNELATENENQLPLDKLIENLLKTKPVTRSGDNSSDFDLACAELASDGLVSEITDQIVSTATTEYGLVDYLDPGNIPEPVSENQQLHPPTYAEMAEEIPELNFLKSEADVVTENEPEEDNPPQILDKSLEDLLHQPETFIQPNHPTGEAFNLNDDHSESLEDILKTETGTGIEDHELDSSDSANHTLQLLDQVLNEEPLDFTNQNPTLIAESELVLTGLVQQPSYQEIVKELQEQKSRNIYLENRIRELEQAASTHSTESQYQHY